MATTQAERAEQKLEIRRCAKDFDYWLSNYTYMWQKEGGDAIRWEPWDCQHETARLFMEHKKIIILKTRQLGMSWLTSAYVLWKTMFIKNFHAYYTSIGMKEVGEQMERIRFIFMQLPEWMRDYATLGGRGCKDNDTLIEFTNGSAIHSTASGKSAGHGSAPGLFVCDEWSRVENALLKWRAINPSLGKNSQIIVVSTSDGLNNHFGTLWVGATSGSNGFQPVFWGVDAHPDYTEEYLEERKNDFLGDLTGYLQAYPRTPEDAFLAASRSIFDHARIKEWKQYLREHKINPIIGTIYVEDEIDDEGFVNNGRKFVVEKTGHTQIWKMPEPGHHYTIGADVAQGLVGGDWSVAVVFDTDTREIVCVFRAKIAPEEYAYPLLNMANFYNKAWLAVEVNTASELIMSDLKMNYPWLYRREQRTTIYDLPTMVPGFYTSPTSKPRIITQMRREFSSKERPLRIYSDIVLDEMLSFEQTDNRKLEAAKGYHDDCVMATAIAIEAETTMPVTSDSWKLSAETEKRRNWRSL